MKIWIEIMGATNSNKLLSVKTGFPKEALHVTLTYLYVVIMPWHTWNYTMPSLCFRYFVLTYVVILWKHKILRKRSNGFAMCRWHKTWYNNKHICMSFSGKMWNHFLCSAQLWVIFLINNLFEIRWAKKT